MSGSGKSEDASGIRVQCDVVAKKVIGHHLILMLYGHWLPTDPRGSGSEDFYDDKFAPLGDIHQGRKPERLQPARDELRHFHQEAEPLLNFSIVWMDQIKRRVVAESIRETIRERGYTCWACAVLRNHAHLVIRIHRDDGRTMWEHFANGIRERLRLRFPNDWNAAHPVISARPYDVFLYTPQDVRTRIAYVERNPPREGLLAQHYNFVTPYNSWPLHKKQSTQQ